jgi:hypothetical protein
MWTVVSPSIPADVKKEAKILGVWVFEYFLTQYCTENNKKSFSTINYLTTKERKEKKRNEKWIPL